MSYLFTARALYPYAGGHKEDWFVIEAGSREEAVSYFDGRWEDIPHGVYMDAFIELVRDDSKRKYLSLFTTLGSKDNLIGVRLTRLAKDGGGQKVHIVNATEDDVFERYPSHSYKNIEIVQISEKHFTKKQPIFTYRFPLNYASNRYPRRLIDLVCEFL